MAPRDVWLLHPWGRAQPTISSTTATVRPVEGEPTVGGCTSAVGIPAFGGGAVSVAPCASGSGARHPNPRVGMPPDSMQQVTSWFE